VAPGELIIVPEAELVWVVGNVVSQKSLVYREGVRLTQAIAMVGGVAKHSDLVRIRIYPNSSSRPIANPGIFTLKAVLDNRSEDPVLQPSDIVEISDETGTFRLPLSPPLWDPTNDASARRSTIDPEPDIQLLMNVTLITGASSGIGEAFARKLAARGHNLLLVSRTEEKLMMLCNEAGRSNNIRAEYFAVDLSRPDAPQRLFEETQKRELEIDLLINNAGFGSMGDFRKLDLDRELNMIDLNIRSLVELTHRFIQPMRERKSGAIMNVASTAGFQPVPFMATYAATKAFVLSFSEALWEENRTYGIKVMALCPGVTETNFFEASSMQRPPARTSQTPERSSWT
jgi:short-subunit dehydrogenase